MEARQQWFITDKEARQLVDDKIDPVKDRMARIETKLDEVIQLLLSQNNKKS